MRELQLDSLFPRMSRNEHMVCIDSSLALGQETAARFSGQGPVEIARKLGVSFKMSDTRMQMAGRPVRAEYDSGTDTITLCRESVATVQALLGELGVVSTRRQVGGIGEECGSLALDVHIAHELFHHVESQLGLRAKFRMPNVKVAHIGRFSFGANPIRVCREIAAHKFAKDITRLPFLPSALDLLQDIQSQNRQDAGDPTCT